MTGQDKAYAQKCAKFVINELQGIIRKRKISLAEFDKLIEKRVVAILVHWICQGLITTKQAKDFLNDELDKEGR